jgi:hypothetical protein
MAVTVVQILEDIGEQHRQRTSAVSLPGSRFQLVWTEGEAVVPLGV